MSATGRSLRDLMEEARRFEFSKTEIGRRVIMAQLDGSSDDGPVTFTIKDTAEYLELLGSMQEGIFGALVVLADNVEAMAAAMTSLAERVERLESELGE